MRMEVLARRKSFASVAWLHFNRIEDLPVPARSDTPPTGSGSHRLSAQSLSNCQRVCRLSGSGAGRAKTRWNRRWHQEQGLGPAL
ncbi:hypothetical protein ACFFX0_30505 [Citricoccus parietis]|uniref:Uncharacterized protein n=1 Tax=Citricoccus parietis TaxID=592307 RepID=A0ABV5G8K6_9MICC